MKDDNNYWKKVEDYAATVASFGNNWIRADIYYEMCICRRDGEPFLCSMSDKEFDAFVGDVSRWYYNTYYQK